MSYDRRRLRGYHPAACTCVDCKEGRRQRPPGSTPPESEKPVWPPRSLSPKPPLSHPTNCPCPGCQERRRRTRQRPGSAISPAFSPQQEAPKGEERLAAEQRWQVAKEQAEEQARERAREQAAGSGRYHPRWCQCVVCSEAREQEEAQTAEQQEQAPQVQPEPIQQEQTRQEPAQKEQEQQRQIQQTPATPPSPTKPPAARNDRARLNQANRANRANQFHSYTCTCKACGDVREQQHREGRGRCPPVLDPAVSEAAGDSSKYPLEVRYAARGRGLLGGRCGVVDYKLFLFLGVGGHHTGDRE